MPVNVPEHSPPREVSDPVAAIAPVVFMKSLLLMAFLYVISNPYLNVLKPTFRY